ncbi:glycine zipper family protein [Acidocella sp.]|uniref:glycine zipper family protein n=1 Tax=Acidocella sp. TaxID=50710 RepID=UPI003D00A465
MNKDRKILRGTAIGSALLASLALAGCAVPAPTGPTVLVTRGAKVTPTEFQQQDAYCRQTASQTLNSASQQAKSSATTKAVGGTLVGTAAGALLGAAAGNAGMGAAIGAGSGLLLGGGAAALGANKSEQTMQQQYNINYVQCMTSYGNVYHGS